MIIHLKEELRSYQLKEASSRPILSLFFNPSGDCRFHGGKAISLIPKVPQISQQNFSNEQQQPAEKLGESISRGTTSANSEQALSITSDMLGYIQTAAPDGEVFHYVDGVQ